MNNSEKERYAMDYENFLKRGFRFDRRLARPNKRELLNLIDFENGVKNKFLPNGGNQLLDIKNRLRKSIGLIIANADIDEVNEKALNKLFFDIENANSSKGINKVVKSALYFTQENK